MSRHSLLVGAFEDPESLSKFRRQRLAETVFDLVANKLKGKSVFAARCLTGAQEAEQLQGTYYPIRIRPLDMEGKKYST